MQLTFGVILAMTEDIKVRGILEMNVLYPAVIPEYLKNK